MIQLNQDSLRRVKDKISRHIGHAQTKFRQQWLYAQERIQEATLLAADPINYAWWRSQNWGDALNPWLIEKLSGRPVRGWDIGLLNAMKKSGYGEGVEKFMVVGSTLGHMNSDSVVWGAGFMFENEVPHGRAKRILAVRGPLTRNRLVELGIDVKPVYGDPALLLPLYFKPAEKSTTNLGIVPHEAERNMPWVNKIRRDPRVKLIDICCGLEAVVQEITSCSMIASSSLHGLIIADVFEIPWTWLIISDKVGGQGFKFYDYFMSTGRNCIEPVMVGEAASYQDLLRNIRRDPLRVDAAALLEICPFLD